MVENKKKGVDPILVLPHSGYGYQDTKVLTKKRWFEENLKLQSGVR